MTYGDSKRPLIDSNWSSKCFPPSLEGSIRLLPEWGIVFLPGGSTTDWIEVASGRIDTFVLAAHSGSIFIEFLNKCKRIDFERAWIRHSQLRSGLSKANSFWSDGPRLWRGGAVRAWPDRSTMKTKTTILYK
jgi:hypothetical protein